MIINKNKSFFRIEMILGAKLLTYILLFCNLNTNINAQSDTILIKNTIQKMFVSMANFDSAEIKKTFAPSFTLKSILKTKSGETITREESEANFLIAIGTKKEDLKFDERISSYQILIDDNMAMVWTPYEFYLNNVFSHCGVNLFTMVKIDGAWKILAIVDTRRKANYKNE